MRRGSADRDARTFRTSPSRIPIGLVLIAQLSDALSCPGGTVPWWLPIGGGPDARACISVADASDECLGYLRRNLAVWDGYNAESLGFPEPPTAGNKISELRVAEGEGVLRPARRRGTDAGPGVPALPDGLSDGIAGQTVTLALESLKYPWTLHLTKELFLEYVLPFAVVNEARSNWRQYLVSKLEPLISPLNDQSLGPDATVRESAEKVTEVIHTVNKGLWDAVGGVQFKAGKTPLIYDPMSVILFGYGSCTGLSILLVCALRSVGIPARIAGTPAWNGDPDRGNHTWVEVYVPGRGWRILEAGPAGGEQDLDNPCGLWFCNPMHFDGLTKVFASRSDFSLADGHFPMAWDMQNDGVPGDDRSSVMTEMCSKC
eukprot:CAMPEP_0194316260 /NCGR_PEP_ID=MMETSP0171-20130528/13075_1 /TAXON_ID=218684 /ORGANISM="Corethron pennatum, Strain L29A3" /LENGTH=373 /DNA_ID=CAMNT_0039072443 /DNA_START=26 /DNA_END=1147 /DNA_ORIENTATION=-